MLFGLVFVAVLLATTKLNPQQWLTSTLFSQCICNLPDVFKMPVKIKRRKRSPDTWSRFRMTATVLQTTEEGKQGDAHTHWKTSAVSTPALACPHHVTAVTFDKVVTERLSEPTATRLQQISKWRCSLSYLPAALYLSSLCELSWGRITAVSHYTYS